MSETLPKSGNHLSKAVAWSRNVAVVYDRGPVSGLACGEDEQSDAQGKYVEQAGNVEEWGDFAVEYQRDEQTANEQRLHPGKNKAVRRVEGDAIWLTLSKEDVFWEVAKQHQRPDGGNETK